MIENNSLILLWVLSTCVYGSMEIIGETRALAYVMKILFHWMNSIANSLAAELAKKGVTRFSMSCGTALPLQL